MLNKFLILLFLMASMSFAQKLSDRDSIASGAFDDDDIFAVQEDSSGIYTWRKVYVSDLFKEIKDTIRNLEGTYFLMMIRPTQTEELAFEYLDKEITIDSLRTSTYDSSFTFNIRYSDDNYNGSPYTDMFTSNQTVTAQSPSSVTLYPDSGTASAGNYLRLYVVPLGVLGEYYDFKIYYSY